jgi:hypothetical protein
MILAKLCKSKSQASGNLGRLLLYHSSCLSLSCRRRLARCLARRNRTCTTAWSVCRLGFGCRGMRGRITGLRACPCLAGARLARCIARRKCIHSLRTLRGVFTLVCGLLCTCAACFTFLALVGTRQNLLTFTFALGFLYAWGHRVVLVGLAAWVWCFQCVLLVG